MVKDGETGFLVEGHDPARYAERILALLGNPTLASKLSHAAVEHAARYSWDATASEIGGVYRELLSRRAG